MPRGHRILHQRAGARLKILIISLALMGCHGQSSHSPPVAHPPVSDVDNEGNCEDWCSTRLPKEGEGWCTIGTVHGGGDCIQQCQDLRDSGSRIPLRECIEGSPLCYWGLEKCIENKR